MMFPLNGSDLFIRPRRTRRLRIESQLYDDWNWYSNSVACAIAHVAGHRLVVYCDNRRRRAPL